MSFEDTCSVAYFCGSERTNVMMIILRKEKVIVIHLRSVNRRSRGIGNTTTAFLQFLTQKWYTCKFVFKNCFVL